MGERERTRRTVPPQGIKQFQTNSFFFSFFFFLFFFCGPPVQTGIPQTKNPRFPSFLHIHTQQCSPFGAAFSAQPSFPAQFFCFDCRLASSMNIFSTARYEAQTPASDISHPSPRYVYDDPRSTPDVTTSRKHPLRSPRMPHNI